MCSLESGHSFRTLSIVYSYTTLHMPNLHWEYPRERGSMSLFICCVLIMAPVNEQVRSEHTPIAPTSYQTPVPHETSDYFFLVTRICTNLLHLFSLSWSQAYLPHHSIFLKNRSLYPLFFMLLKISEYMSVNASNGFSSSPKLSSTLI
jgi:hypothetical protein